MPQTAFLITIVMVPLFATAVPLGDHDTSNQEQQPTNTTSTSEETPSDTPISGLAIFFSLAGLAFNAALQRSGADEFPYEQSFSPARISPFICAADVLVAVATIISGSMGGLTFRKSCALYVSNTRVHLSDPRPGRSRPSRNRVRLDTAGLVFAVLGSLKLVFGKGLDARIIVYAAAFLLGVVTRLRCYVRFAGISSTKLTTPSPHGLLSDDSSDLQAAHYYPWRRLFSSLMSSMAATSDLTLTMRWRVSDVHVGGC